LGKRYGLGVAVAVVVVLAHFHRVQPPRFGLSPMLLFPPTPSWTIAFVEMTSHTGVYVLKQETLFLSFLLLRRWQLLLTSSHGMYLASDHHRKGSTEAPRTRETDRKPSESVSVLILFFLIHRGV